MTTNITVRSVATAAVLAILCAASGLLVVQAAHTGDAKAQEFTAQSAPAAVLGRPNWQP